MSNTTDWQPLIEADIPRGAARMRNNSDRQSLIEIVAFPAIIILAGLSGALAVWAFRHAFGILETLFLGSDNGLVAAARALPSWRRLLTPLLGALAAGLVLQFFQRRHRDDGPRPPTDYIEAFTAGHGRLYTTGALIKCLASLFVVSCGLAVGREGAMILLAALLGSMIGGLLPENFGNTDGADPTRAGTLEEKRRILVACGAAAGMAAAYHAPVAGVFFTAEVLAGGALSLRFLGPVALAAFCSRLLTGGLSGFSPLYMAPVLDPPSVGMYVPLCILAVFCGVCGAGFLIALDGTRDLFVGTCKSLGLPVAVQLGVGGLLVGLLSLWYPEVWGNGASTVRVFVHAPPLAAVVAAILIAKFLAMLASTGGGAPGGVLTPTLFVGAAFGLLLGHGFSLLPAFSGPTALFTLCGMAGFLAATTHAPIMSAFMIAEMSGAYDLLPGLLFVCLLASGLAGRLRPRSIYGL